MMSSKANLSNLLALWDTKSADDYTRKNQSKCPYCKKDIRCQVLAAHLLACREKYPVMAQQFKICQYNRSHHIEMELEKDHYDNCPSRLKFIEREVRAGHGNPEVEVQGLLNRLEDLPKEMERRERQLLRPAEVEKQLLDSCVQTANEFCGKSTV